MNSVAVAIVLLMAVVCAEPGGYNSYGHGVGHHGGRHHSGTHHGGGYHGGGHKYHGQYHSQCGADGFYYKDARSFVICSNGNAYVQPCAPGSRNSGNYNRGGYYRAHHFCDVNLVDHGYGARHGYGHSHGHGHGGHGYGHSHGHGHGHGHNAHYSGSYGRGNYNGY